MAKMKAKKPEKYKKRATGGSNKIIFPDVTCLPQTVMAAILGIGGQTLNAWDCPRNSNGTYSSAEVISWRIEKMNKKPNEKGDLEKDKLRLQCEKMEIEISDLKLKNISIEDHQQILLGRAESLKRYWTETFKRNLHHFCHKSIEQIRPLAERFIREAMNTYSRTHR
jgi:hypothetical protein